MAPHAAMFPIGYSRFRAGSLSLMQWLEGGDFAESHIIALGLC